MICLNFRAKTWPILENENPPVWVRKFKFKGVAQKRFFPVDKLITQKFDKWLSSQLNKFKMDPPPQNPPKEDLKAKPKKVRNGIVQYCLQLQILFWFQKGLWGTFLTKVACCGCCCCWINATKIVGSLFLDYCMFKLVKST